MKLSINKKKIIVLTSMVLLLVVAGTLNFVLNATLKDNTPGGGVTTTFFSQQRTIRETSRSEQIAWLDSIINSETSSKEAIASAEQEKLTLTKNKSTEVAIETLVKARGFQEVIVTLANDKINVIVQKPGMTEADANLIRDIIIEQTKSPATAVEVIPYQIV